MTHSSVNETSLILAIRYPSSLGDLRWYTAEIHANAAPLYSVFMGPFFLSLFFSPVLLSLIRPSSISALVSPASFLNPYKENTLSSASLSPSILLTSFEITQQQLFFLVYFAGPVPGYSSQLLQRPTTGCTGYIRTVRVMILCFD